MKSRRFFLAITFALVLSLVFAFGLSPLMKPSTAAPAPVDNSPFKGKVVVVNLKSKYSENLEQAQVRKLGEHSFLVGKGIDDGQPARWTKGQMVWVPLDQVETIVEFESVERMRKAWEEYQKNVPAPAPKPAGQVGSP